MWVKKNIPLCVTLDGSAGAVFQGDATKEGALDPFFGKAALVYMDPPYLTGEDFHCRVKIGRQGYLKGKPEMVLPAYTDKFDSMESYMVFLKGLCETAYQLLKEDGSLYLHLDYRAGAYAKIMLDEVFGREAFTNEIIWVYETGGRSTRHFSRKHDVILYYRKSPKAYFDIAQVSIPRKDNRHNHMKKQMDETGRISYSINTNGKTYTYHEDEPVYPSDVWADVSHLQQKDPQRTGYDTQKPMKLMERIIRSSSKKGDWVADLCFGSGTALVCAAEEERRFLGMDLSAPALATAQKRLLGKAYSLTRDCDMTDCRLDAQISPGLGLYEITLADFTFDIDAPCEIHPLDLVDQWAVGIVKDGVFKKAEWSARTKQTPDLETTLRVPMVSGAVGVEVIDVLMRKHVYIWDACAS